MIRKHTSELPPEYQDVLSGLLSPQQGMSSVCKWRSWNLNMEDTCKCIGRQKEVWLFGSGNGCGAYNLP